MALNGLNANGCSEMVQNNGMCYFNSKAKWHPQRVGNKSCEMEEK